MTWSLLPYIVSRAWESKFPRSCYRSLLSSGHVILVTDGHRLLKWIGVTVRTSLIPFGLLLGCMLLRHSQSFIFHRFSRKHIVCFFIENICVRHLRGTFEAIVPDLNILRGNETKIKSESRVCPSIAIRFLAQPVCGGVDQSLP